MIARLTGALMASLLLLAAPGAMAAGGLERDAQRVYDDYRSDGRIAPCRHTAGVYRDTLKQIDGAIEEESPAFKPATEAALEAREHESCNGEAPSASGTGTTGSTADPGTPGSTAPEVGTDGAAPVAPEDQTAGDGGAAPAAPAEPSTGGAPAPAAPAAPAPALGSAEQVLVNRPYVGAPLGLLIAAALLACALVAWLAALAARRFGWGEERLAGARHAWGEASFRAGGTWGDFLDWVRLGR